MKKVCTVCGVEFNVAPSSFEKRKFCSQACNARNNFRLAAKEKLVEGLCAMDAVEHPLIASGLGQAERIQVAKVAMGKVDEGYKEALLYTNKLKRQKIRASVGYVEENGKYVDDDGVPMD